MSKGRPSIILTKEDLQEQINLAEDSREFTNISSLCEFIENTNWAKTRLNSAGNIQALKKQVIYSRIKEWELTHKTIVNKRSEKAVKIVKVKLSDFKKPELNYSDVPEKYLALAKKAEKSKVAAIKFKCLDCSYFQPKEVRDCLVVNCPLYLHRPFQRKNNDVTKLIDEIIDEELVLD